MKKLQSLYLIFLIVSIVGTSTFYELAYAGTSDLSISIAHDASISNPGAPVTISVTVINNGPDPTSVGLDPTNTNGTRLRVRGFDSSVAPDWYEFESVTMNAPFGSPGVDYRCVTIPDPFDSDRKIVDCVFLSALPAGDGYTANIVLVEQGKSLYPVIITGTTYNVLDNDLDPENNDFSEEIELFSLYCGETKDFYDAVFDFIDVFNDSSYYAIGTAGNDLIVGTLTDDYIIAEGGDDCIYASGGNDIISGRGGNDEIHGQDGDDFIRGNNGNDIIFGEAGFDTLMGDDGDDEISGGNDFNTILGGKGNDIINGGNEGNKINGNRGNDVINGGDAQDFLIGGRGDDNISGGGNSDRCLGYDGTNTIDCEVVLTMP